MHISYSTEAKIFSRAFYPKKLELLTHSEALVMAFQNCAICQIKKLSSFLHGSRTSDSTAKNEPKLLHIPIT